MVSLTGELITVLVLFGVRSVMTVVGNAFVQQYYNIQHQSPGLVHRFYQDISKLGRPDDDGTMSMTTTMHAIDEKILSLKYGSSGQKLNPWMHKNLTMVESMSLLPEHRSVSMKWRLLSLQSRILLQCRKFTFTEETLVTVEVNGEETVNGSINGDVSVVEEEVPVAEVVDEVPDDSNVVVESHSKIEEVPKKSYASIVSDGMKESAMPLSSPSPVPRRSLAKSQEQPVNLAQALALALVPEGTGFQCRSYRKWG
ncbi:nuclear transport factor 2 (NTF2) family protein with RNA binding (RRM-RBD-RNP motifs) domain-containing protein [Actinidia rufa]|uniref:Nuclear transport factor 2 (NTF2) family protein with RNA binding (RRM-RBD-RNP motifs) domain-containing protein n=1 Tax=Actinidia rufa TaxID=165716 RepID=A0A7J0FTQ1_9ERIC|nr:nuclear transport factor 2 (NTF2) family protein with RNA binding (RRM-RBD-RNP motifs) domain-containing protein [Actinidia rufa]